MTAAGFTCPDCGITSYHPSDVEYGYCGRCHAFTGRGIHLGAPQDRGTDLLGMVQPGTLFLENVHPESACEGRGCVIHHPSDHPMRGWPLLWRGDLGFFERTCPHGVGHPDPDDATYLATVGAVGKTVHGCDGCCTPQPEGTTP